jgi:hypothetical protein
MTYESVRDGRMCFSESGSTVYDVDDKRAEKRDREHAIHMMQVARIVLEARASFDDLPKDKLLSNDLPKEGRFDHFDYALDHTKTKEYGNHSVKIELTSRGIACAPIPKMDASTRYITIVRYPADGAIGVAHGFYIWILDGTPSGDAPPATDAPKSDDPPASSGGPEASTSAQNLADTIAAQPNLGRYLRYAKSTGLIDVLKGSGPYTVFANTDAAFERDEGARGRSGEAEAALPAPDARGLPLHRRAHGEEAVAGSLVQDRRVPPPRRARHRQRRSHREANHDEERHPLRRGSEALIHSPRRLWEAGARSSSTATWRSRPAVLAS